MCTVESDAVAFDHFIDRVIRRLDTYGHLDGFSDEDLIRILEHAQKLLEPQPALIEVRAPVTVFADLKRFLELVGRPPQTRMLFLGDYVDRCKSSMEKPRLNIDCDVGIPLDLMWADPSQDTCAVGWQYNKIRNASWMFGADTIRDFCRLLDIDLIVRAHEATKDGHQFHGDKNQLCTIFSAPNYCGIDGNCASVLRVSEKLEISFLSLRPRLDLTQMTAERRAELHRQAQAMEVKSPLPGGGPHYQPPHFTIQPPIYEQSEPPIVQAAPVEQKSSAQQPSTLKVAPPSISPIPGDGGSRLIANLTGKPEVVHYLCDRVTKDYFDLWLNLESFVPLAIDCWTDNMKLIFDNTTKRSTDAPGVDVQIPYFGGTSGVEWLDPSQRSPGRYFQPIVDALVSWGYTRSKNVVGAPYDWRRSPGNLNLLSNNTSFLAELNDYYTMLKTLIMTIYRYNGHKKVIIVAHSMGNPVMNYFYQNYVDQKWKDTHILTHVAISPPWGGAIQIVKLFASGYNMDYCMFRFTLCAQLSLVRVILPPSALRPMQRSFTSSAFLFPSTRLWGKDEPVAVTFERNYTVADYKQFFMDVGYPLGIDQYEMAHTALETDAPGIRMHCIYGHDVATPELLTWAKGYFPDYQPVITYGTVNRRSLEVCKKWKGNNGGKLVTVHELESADHLGILADIRTIQLIKDILYNAPAKY
ncbi:hypothetical protein M3Y98_00468400 [Aphelenchoides besseyi]|nr:hypothetical protein M3Y98_00468400 [Aphelenchoides besseyi]